MKRLGAEGGSVLVTVAAAMFPIVFLMALVIDAGNWFTHDRQLQTRADAAAHAAAVEYSRRWRECISSATSASTGNDIATQAKSYAGVGHNDQISRGVAVVINSAGWDPLADNSDGGGPCFNHAPGDPTSAGFWTDVKVQEEDVSSFFLADRFLERSGANARVELRPGSSQNFLPLAAPESEIERAQVWLYRDCPGGDTKIAEIPLSEAGTINGLASWEADASVEMPAIGSCGAPDLDSIPVRAEVRLASRAMPLTGDCDSLRRAPFTDCFDNVGRIRAHDEGGPTAEEPAIHAVNLSGGSCRLTPHFVHELEAEPNCTFLVSVGMEWTQAQGTFVVKADGTPLNRVGDDQWIGEIARDPAAPQNADEITISYQWTSNDPDCEPIPPSACSISGEETNAHQSVYGLDDETGVLRLVQYTLGASSTYADSLPAGAPADIRLTIGVRSALQFGPELTALRWNAGRGGLALTCDPQYTDVVVMFQNGCKPFYGANDFRTETIGSTIWWSGTRCPATSDFFNGPEYLSMPWRCLATYAGDSETGGKVAEGIAHVTRNFPTCNSDSRYHEYTSSDSFDSSDPRLIRVFVIPFGSGRGQDPDYGIPVVDWGWFYVTDWMGSGATLAERNDNGDPCSTEMPPSDLPRTAGSVYGHFVDYAPPGATDPHLRCDPAQLRPCKAVLVR